MQYTFTTENILDFYMRPLCTPDIYEKYISLLMLNLHNQQSLKVCATIPMIRTH